MLLNRKKIKLSVVWCDIKKWFYLSISRCSFKFMSVFRTELTNNIRTINPCIKTLVYISFGIVGQYVAGILFQHLFHH